jgi:hypothetical protein
MARTNRAKCRSLARRLRGSARPAYYVRNLQSRNAEFASSVNSGPRKENLKR